MVVPNIVRSWPHALLLQRLISSQRGRSISQPFWRIMKFLKLHIHKVKKIMNLVPTSAVQCNKPGVNQNIEIIRATLRLVLIIVFGNIIDIEWNRYLILEVKVYFCVVESYISFYKSFGAQISVLSLKCNQDFDMLVALVKHCLHREIAILKALWGKR